MGIDRRGRERRKNVLRTLGFVFERFGEHELANHAAAGAYAFLLSATPALLLVVGLATSLFSAWPEARDALFEITTEVFEGLPASGPASGPLVDFFSRRLGLGAALFALVSLVWAARLFILTVQRGLRVVWGVSPLEKPVRDNLVTFGLEFAALVLVVLVLTGAEAFRFLLGFTPEFMSETVRAVSVTLLRSLPPLLLFLYAYFTYLLIPPRGPRRSTAALAALLCVVVYASFSIVLDFAINRSHYDLLYGVFGGLVAVLLRVWAFFTVYFHCAEFAFILDNYDALLFSRFLDVSRRQDAGRIARSLYARPARILRRYGKRVAAGELIFREGDQGREAYYLLEGTVGIYLGEGGVERRVSTIGEGELFGEIAELIAEGRSATARAETELEVVVLPPELLRNLIDTDSRTARRLIDLLSRRLKEANIRLFSEGAMSPREP